MKRHRLVVSVLSASCLLAACGGGGEPDAAPAPKGMASSDVPLSSAEIKQIVDVAEAGYAQMTAVAPVLAIRLPELIDKYLPLLAQIPAGSRGVSSLLLQALVPGLACDNAAAGGTYSVNYTLASNGGLAAGDKLNLSFTNCVVQGMALDGKVGLNLVSRSADGKQMAILANLSALSISDGVNAGKLDGTVNANVALSGAGGSLSLVAERVTVSVPAGTAAGTYALTDLKASQAFNLDGSGLSSEFLFNVAVPQAISSAQKVAVRTLAPIKATMAGDLSKLLGGTGVPSSFPLAFDSNSGSISVTGYRGATILVTPRASKVDIAVDRNSDGQIDESHTVAGNGPSQG